jgi:hypothetical protein
VRKWGTGGLRRLVQGVSAGFDPWRLKPRLEQHKAPQTARGCARRTVWGVLQGDRRTASFVTAGPVRDACHPEGAPRRTVWITTPGARPKDLASAAWMPAVAPLTRGNPSAQADIAFPQPRIHSPRDCGRRVSRRRTGILPRDCGRRAPRRRAAVSLRDRGRRLARRDAPIRRSQSAKADFAPFPRRIHSLQGRRPPLSHFRTLALSHFPPGLRTRAEPAR